LQYKYFRGNYKQHNAALKYFRMIQEDAVADPGMASPYVFSNNKPEEISAIMKGKGMDFSFDDSRKVAWGWWELVAQMDEASIARVCEGKSGRSCGLLSCSLETRPGSYDHKRHHALKQLGYDQPEYKLPIWDFVILREDGSAIRLHPEWKDGHIETWELEGHTPEIEPPVGGLGASDGRGTFRRYKEAQTKERLLFDKTKGKGLQP
jgi:hypothetical protein